MGDDRCDPDGTAPPGGWPRLPGVILACAAAAILALSLLQRDQRAQGPTGLRVAVAGLALLPWLLQVWRLPPRGALIAVALPTAAVLGWHHSADAVWFVPILALVEDFVVWGNAAGGVDTVLAMAVVVASSVSDPIGAGNWIGWYLGTLAGAFGGWAVRTQRALVAELRDAQAELARQSARDERRRIAREIHDVIAHSLTVTMLHLSAARLAVRTDPGEAEEALLEAERVGRQSLADVRRTVDLLSAGDGGGEGTRAPLPGAADIAALVQQFAAAGLDVQLQVQGDAATVAPATGLGLYRIAQESLANVVKHAPGARVVVDLDINAQSVSLRVRNGAADGVPGEAPAAPGGFGIGGMAQRAALLGGTVEAGPHGGGWQVSVTVPAGASPSPAPS